jgi:hypothetical protein
MQLAQSAKKKGHGMLVGGVGERQRRRRWLSGKRRQPREEGLMARASGRQPRPIAFKEQVQGFVHRVLCATRAAPRGKR